MSNNPNDKPFNADLDKFIRDIVPHLAHCKVLQIGVEDVKIGELTLSLPYSDKIIGNKDTRVIHGGALTTLMDTACGFAAISALAEEGYDICPTLDLRIDYMCPAEPEKLVLGRAETYRVTSNVIFVRGSAYHPDQEDAPIAHCTATFMRISPRDAEINNKVSAPTANPAQK